MTIIQAHQISLSDVHRLQGWQRQYNSSFLLPLSLTDLTEFEQQELSQIRQDFDNYLLAGRVSEGQVKLLTVAPLLRLAGFYRAPIKISLEEEIARIEIPDEDTTITGRFDILAVNNQRQTSNNVLFWILVIECKNSQIAPNAGLPQLLSYAYKSLQYQECVWGLTTNGNLYQFVYMMSGNPPVYQLMPFLNLMETQASIQLLQVLKAIGKL
ncbi:MAG: restriction endonuclease subunit R [Oscillatoria sp. PMC 1068.18]|nr:restriction endonuclease subunit R [Oscillatoria sp. PMC 1076.18]MEC4991475.1 restriction endonuclease subunit R [Oscillatoria sp. PMC 1068.18]